MILGLTRVIEEHTTPILWNDDEMYFNRTIEKYDTTLAEYCSINNVEYLKMFDVLKDEDFSDDGIHPNDNGHEKKYIAIKAKGENRYE